MSAISVQQAPSFGVGSTDADLLVRIGIVLASRQRASWRAVRVDVRHGIARLIGIVPTAYDHELIAAVTSRVAGVFGVANELKVEKQKQPTPPKEATTVKPTASREPKTAPSPRRNKFVDLPVLEESLEDILTRQAATDAT